MASFFIGILAVILVFNCLLLILLVLIQLPKKDAGAGMAFGGAAADALFGAGSGNVLTKITKWATIVFFVLAIFLGYLENRMHNQGGSVMEFENQLQQKQQQVPVSIPQPATAPAAAPVPANNLLSVPLAAPTNVPSAPAQSK